MTEQSNADLIGEATRAAQAVYLATDERLADDLSRIIHTLAERLEAADQRAAQAEAELKDAYRTDIPSLKEQRDELAAVVEKVLSHDPLHGADSGLHCGGMAPCIRDILATAPADALRELKAEAIREYVTAARENPHTYYWPPSGVLDDAEQWADEIEKGTI